MNSRDINHQESLMMGSKEIVDYQDNKLLTNPSMSLDDS